MRVLITGCNGQVGYCLTERLKGKAETLALDYEGLDITDQEAVIKTVADFKPDYIINAAAHTAVDRAEQEVELSNAINRDGPQYLAQAAENCGAVMLHISTDYVFDGEGDRPYLESDQTAPQGVYGQSKLAGEQAVANECSKYLILRTAWVFAEHGNNFVKTMLHLAQTRDELKIVCDQFGGPTYAGDIADALIAIVKCIEKNKKIEWGIYHFSGLPHVSWLEFAQEVFDIATQQKILHRKPRIEGIKTEQYLTLAKRPLNSCLDTNKIKEKFSIEASDWKLALKSTIEMINGKN